MNDLLNYEGKICVVTGAASGMGKETTEMLVDLGAEVYALDIAEVTSPGIKEFIQISLSEKKSIDQAFEKIPKNIDCFFGIAGVSGVKTDYTTTVTINYISNKYMVEQYLFERMNPNGAISFITSSGGLRWEKEEHIKEFKTIVDSVGWEETLNALNNLNQQNMPGALGYAFSKRTMNYFIASIVPKFGEKKVRVNGVLPAATQSGLTKDFVDTVGGMDNLLKSTGQAGRLADSKEMAAPLIFLNSDMASYISGVLLNVDYGQDIQIVAGFKEDNIDIKLLQ